MQTDPGVPVMLLVLHPVHQQPYMALGVPVYCRNIGPGFVWCQLDSVCGGASILTRWSLQSFWVVGWPWLSCTA